MVFVCASFQEYYLTIILLVKLNQETASVKLLVSLLNGARIVVIQLVESEHFLHTFDTT